MNIITLTLNPAFDMHAEIGELLLHRENLAHVTERDAGGKGVNISRALTENGVPNLAVVVVGEENGEDFCCRLREDGVNFRVISTKGRIRENLTLHETDGRETRISFEGFSADDSVLARVEVMVLPLLSDVSYLCFTGRMPTGMDKHALLDFLCRAKENGARLVLDSNSLTLDDLLALRPFLIKPNQEEISAYLGREIESLAQASEAAENLHAQGIENVMISLGEQGALLVNDSGHFAARPPHIDVKSTIGAGDSSIAGFLAATSGGKRDADALREAVAYGTAACLLAGTRPPNPCDVERIRKQIN